MIFMQFLAFRQISLRLMTQLVFNGRLRGQISEHALVYDPCECAGKVENRYYKASMGRSAKDDNAAELRWRS